MVRGLTLGSAGVRLELLPEESDVGGQSEKEATRPCSNLDQVAPLDTCWSTHSSAAVRCFPFSRAKMDGKVGFPLQQGLEEFASTPPSAPSDDDSQTANMSLSSQQKPSQRSIPIYRTLEEVYPDTHLQQASVQLPFSPCPTLAHVPVWCRPTTAPPPHRERWNALLESFEKVYKKKAEFVCRAPGRVKSVLEAILLLLCCCSPC